MRYASDAYFSQELSVIHIPDQDSKLRDAIASVWEYFLQYVENIEDLKKERRKKIPVATALEGLDDEKVYAEIQRRLSHLDVAMQDCDEAIRLDAASAAAHDLRGRVRTDAKQYEHALDDFDRAIRLDRNLASAFAGRAATFALMRQHRLAVRDYTEAIRRDPRSTQFLADRAAEYVKVRRIDLAVLGRQAGDGAFHISNRG